MIRYKVLGNNQWFETDKHYYDDEYNPFFYNGVLFEVHLYTYFFKHCQLTEINIENIDKIILHCNENYIKRFNVCKYTWFLKSDNIKIIGTSEDMEIKFMC